MKVRWFLLFFRKSLSRRKGRVVIASFSVTIAVAVITGMIGITSGISEKLGSELKAYGANIIVSQGDGGYIDYEMMNLFSKIDTVKSSVGQLYDSISFRDQTIEIFGMDVGQLKDRGWRLAGNWPDKKREILAGVNIEKSMNLYMGAVVPLPGGRGNQERTEFVVTGFVETGGDEDASFIMSLADAWDATGMHNKLSAVLVRSGPGKLEKTVEDIKAVMPRASVKTVRQVALAEESFLNKIQLLMMLVTAVVLFAALISVTSTMGANVLERRTEIGLMLALGARKNEIRLFYVAEAMLVGLSGGMGGFLLGALAAQLISKGAFGSYISVPVSIVFISISAGLLITLFASHFPVKNALKQSPALILRGE